MSDLGEKSQQVLAALAEREELYGHEIARRINAAPATVYRVLYRLYARGYVLDRLEDESDQMSRSRRRYWRLNPDPPETSELERLRAENKSLKKQLRERPEGLRAEFQTLIADLRKDLLSTGDGDV
jgi:transcription initiation factor IIE alpha subunit